MFWTSEIDFLTFLKTFLKFENFQFFDEILHFPLLLVMSSLSYQQARGAHPQLRPRRDLAAAAAVVRINFVAMPD